MKKYIILLTLINMIGCSTVTKRRHITTINLCKSPAKKCPCNLFLEVFSDYDQGAFGTGINSNYITDSVSFRTYIGTYDDENEVIATTCNGVDSIYTEKRIKKGPSGTPNSIEIQEKAVYSIDDLKKQHVFDR